MASRPKWQFTKEKFSRDFEILNVSRLFHPQQPINRHFVAIREVLGATDLQVDLSFDFSDCDEATQKKGLKEAKTLWNRFIALEKCWSKNQKNRKPRWAGFKPGEIFISSDDFEVLFRPKSKLTPTPLVNHDDSR